MSVPEPTGSRHLRQAAKKREAPHHVVAIPARDEEDRIGACLRSIACQVDIDHAHLSVVVLLNNTSDGSRGVIADVANATGLSVDVVDVVLGPERANAGWARKLAMDHARSCVANDGMILTTDADTVVDPDWIGRTRGYIASGMDAVAGYVTADDVELKRIDAHVLELGAKEWELQHLLAEIDARMDPISHDPWPRHNQNCGASLAITAAMYDRVGGLPAVSVGEDRALMDQVRAVDGRIRHAFDVHVVTSARLVGRASGGMADALRTRGGEDYFCDDILEPAHNAERRAMWRAQARKAYRAGDIVGWCTQHGLSSLAPASALPFGALWSRIETEHPSLSWTLLRVSELDDELAAARAIARDLRLLVA